MHRIWTIPRLIPITVSLLLSSCAYFNTFYNAEKYFNEADRIRLEKSDKAVPLRAMDNYGKTIQKCKIVLSDFPESKYVNDAILLMAKAQFYRSEYDNAISNLKIIYKINDFLLKNFKPDFTFLHTINIPNMFLRLKKRKSINRYDKFDKIFYNKVQKGFIKLSKKNKNKYKIIDSNKDIHVNKNLILDKIDLLIK